MLINIKNPDESKEIVAIENRISDLKDKIKEMYLKIENLRLKKTKK